MNREIKFRGKRSNGRWVYGSLVVSKKIDPAIYFNISKGAAEVLDWCYVKPDTIGQYTGLKDKEGNKIFEGDIVEFTNLDLPNMVIRFDNGSFMLCEDENSTYEELRMNYVVEVVGNIHDNPELIK